jgi:hypothetical protein
MGSASLVCIVTLPSLGYRDASADRAVARWRLRGYGARVDSTATAEIRCLATSSGCTPPFRVTPPAVECAGRTLTFAELYERARAVAGALAGSGVGAQDRVALIERNGIEALEVVFGAALLNAVVVNVNWRLAPPEILQIVADAQARVVLVGAELVAAVEAIEDELGDKTEIIAFGGHDRWDALRGLVGSPPAGGSRRGGRAGRRGVPAVHIGHHRPAQGGHAHHLQPDGDLASRVGAYWGFVPGQSVNLALMPMFHIAGLGCGRQWACTSGAVPSSCATWCRPRSSGCCPKRGSPTPLWSPRSSRCSSRRRGSRAPISGPSATGLRGLAHLGCRPGAGHCRHGLRLCPGLRLTETTGCDHPARAGGPRSGQPAGPAALLREALPLGRVARRGRSHRRGRS